MILGIAGGSGSGKTTLTKKLHEQFGEENLVILYHDSYYKDITHLTLEERAQTNFDHPDSLDTELLIHHVQELRKGNSIEVPTYDFATHSRTKQVTKVSPRNIIIVEGILIFSNPTLVRQLDLKIYVDSDADIRFIRRLKRDVAERGRTLEDVCSQYQQFVRPMHEKFVEPSKYCADIIVHSTRGEATDMEATIRMVLNHLRVEAGLV
mmetsp:Transcript_21907/g.30858  ORF Transcript_21907/g.30858 Transcript_21907/m.30858 type:complete len:208 (-) Transcript_21907:283-906(-)